MYDDTKPGRSNFHGHGGKGLFASEHWNGDTENVLENDSGNLFDEGYGESYPVWWEDSWWQDEPWEPSANAYWSDHPWSQGASESWAESDWPGPTDVREHDETVNHLLQEQQEAERQQQELQALLAENERSLDQKGRGPSLERQRMGPTSAAAPDSVH